MQGFVQVMEFETSNIDEVEAFARRMETERGDALLARRATVYEDRDRRGTYLVVVEFDSHDEAMKNSDDPETDRYAKEMVGLLDGLPRFRNLDARAELFNRSS